MIHEFSVRSRQQYEAITITPQVEEQVKGVGEGVATVYTPHATAAIVINENYDPHLMQDILDALAALVPEGKWRHDKTDNNGAAHIKAAILGPSEQVLVRNGKLLLGQWQGISLLDLDGPRERKVWVQVTGK